MLYRRFGKTNLNMPVFSAGFMRAKHSWSDLPLAAVPADNQSKLEEVIRRALALGINHFETARAYGTSERQLGLALRDIPRADYLLQTKVQPTPDPQVFTADCRDSLARLGVDRVDLLAIHGINDHRSFWHACRPGGCLAAARRLQAEGRVGHVGFSGHGDTDIILEAVRHQQDGGFDYMNIHWYYIFQQHRQAIREAHERDMGIFVISPTDKGGRLQAPPPLLQRLCAPLAPLQFNDLFCLTRPGITTLSIGAATPADFDAHLAALAHLGDRDLLAAVDRRLGQAMETATGNARPDALWEKLPPWDATPGYFNLRMITWLGNLDRGWHLREYARDRYAMLGRELPWVPGRDGADIDRFDLARGFRSSDLDMGAVLDLVRATHRRLAST
ncbi:MAG: aldo/keto reductase [Thermodesulfobacteriota bacterium]